MRMYHSCVSGMIKNNIDQWDESYPNSEVISEDIKNQSFYVALEVDNKIIGGVNIDQLQEHLYLDINWKDKSGHFLSSRRLGIYEEHWNKGIKSIMNFCRRISTKKILSQSV